MRTLEHGTVHGYMHHKCRCAVCRRAMAAYQHDRVTRGIRYGRHPRAQRDRLEDPPESVEEAVVNLEMMADVARRADLLRMATRLRVLAMWLKQRGPGDER